VIETHEQNKGDFKGTVGAERNKKKKKKKRHAVHEKG